VRRIGYSWEWRIERWKRYLSLDQADLSPCNFPCMPYSQLMWDRLSVVLETKPSLPILYKIPSVQRQKCFSLRETYTHSKILFEYVNPSSCTSD
jgi:hypothetical protein